MAIEVSQNVTNIKNRYLSDSEQIKGGYTEVNTKEDLANLPAKTVVEGSLCYVINENAEYRYVKNAEEQLEWQKIEVSADEPIFVITLKLGGTLERPTAIVESDNIYADLIEFKNTKGHYPKVVGQIDLSVLQQGMLDFEISSFTTYQDRIYLRCNVINTNVVITRYFVLEDMLLDFGVEPEHKYANIKIVEPLKLEPVIIETKAQTQVDGYIVPLLSVDEVNELYNAREKGINGFVNFEPLTGLHIKLDVINTNDNATEKSIRFIYNDIMLLTYTLVENEGQQSVEITEKTIDTPTYHHHIRVFRQANKTSGDEPHTQAHPSFVLYLNLVSKKKEKVSDVADLIQAIYEHMIDAHISGSVQLLGGGVMKFRKDDSWDGELVTYDLIGIEVNSSHYFKFILGSRANLEDDYVATTTTYYEVSTMSDCFLTDDVI